MGKKKIKWGVLSTAKIGVKNVIPSMQKGELSEMVAIASRTIENAKAAADVLGLPKYYGSYEELLSDPEIEAIYNPLPNHLHVPWTIKALEAGKHVLCEKPIGLTAKEAEQLIQASTKYPHLKVMEAFMYRFHPQWEKVNQIIASGSIGELRHIDSVFTFYNTDPSNVRNQADIGGGGVLDIGCYCINLSRMLFGSEPIEVKSHVDLDPVFNTDRLASALLVFEQGTANIMCSTQLEHKQHAIIYGTKGFLELNIPFNSSNEALRKLTISTGGETETILFETCDQYTLQGDAFSLAILENTDVPTPLEDALANMKVIDQVLSHE
ncbi:MAG: gfo/Idh/MocA family oxidoreductase [Balneola sp.]|nr:MAG: gfo/Idh/MocA family oxidoreductase [Balneola sp.]